MLASSCRQNPILGAEVAGEGETATVDQQGQLLTVTGSDQDDVIQLELGETSHRLTVNGDMTEYDATSVSQIVIVGDGGDDTVAILGSADNESLNLTSDGLGVSSNRYDVSVRLAEDVSVSAGEGIDRAVLHDSDGDDVLELRAGVASFTDKDGANFRVIDFDRVMAFADNGGSDAVSFFDTVGDDTFIGKDQFSFMVGPDFWNYARGFETVDAYQQNGGEDTGWLFGTTGDEVLVASPLSSELTLSSGNRVTTHGFANNRVQASGGNDRAVFNGADDWSDRFTWDTESAALTSLQSDSQVSIAAYGFDTVEALGGDTADYAELHGSEADDEFVALPEVVRLVTPTATVLAQDFSLVVSHGHGGDDFAHLQDSAFNDHYLSKPNFAYLAGHGYMNLVTGFEVLDVVATEGGYDFANSQFGAAHYTIVGGQNSLPTMVDEDGETVQAGRFELTSAPGVRINAFTQDDLEQGRVRYQHLNDDPLDLAIEFRLENALGLEVLGTAQFSVNKDGADGTVAITADLFSGAITEVDISLETNFFVLDTTQHWIYGTSRNERIFGFSRARSDGPGNGVLREDGDPDLYYFLTRANQNGQITFPAGWYAELADRELQPPARYAFVEGELTKIGDAELNPAEIDF